MKNKGLAIVPCFGSKTHDFLFETVINKFNFDRSCYRNVREEFSKNIFMRLSIFKVILLLISNIRYLIKGDIRGIYYKQIQIGSVINEEVISCSKTATCDNIILIFKKTLKSIIIIDFYTPLFLAKKINLILCGDEAYVFSGISAQMACMYNIPCYCIKGGYEVYASKYDCIWKTGFRRDDFNSKSILNISENILSESEKILKRLCDNDKSSLHYMSVPDKKVKNSTNTDYSDLDIIIFAHDFFDAPGIRAGNIYVNHVKWIKETIDFLLSKKIKVGVRFHPNSRSKNNPIINKLKKQYNSKVVWVDGELSLKSLKGKIKGIVTVYGTVCLESAYLGIPVVTAGITQWSLVNIAQESKSETEYKLNLASLANGEVMLSEEGVLDLKNNAIRVFALNSLVRRASNKTIYYPFDDIDKNLWGDIFHDKYPASIYQRRESFLNSNQAVKAVTNLVKEIDVTKIFK
jgi:hypothetical protein